MSTKPKRKYGDIRKGAETTAGTNDSVFDKFLLPVKPVHEQETVPSTPPSSGIKTSPTSSLIRPNVSPQRDFQKVANSITRDAIPAGMFNGKAKQLYDCLYSLTRGAITPSMMVRVSRAELMKRSGIGAKITLEQNLRRLITSGLVRMKTIGGIQGGNEYTVYLPEERTTASTPPSTGASSPSNGEKLGVLAPLETRAPSHGLSISESIISCASNTSSKTTTNTDDEAFAQFNQAFRELTRKLTGKQISAVDAERWRELAEVICKEAERAASHTNISNLPAFLTEHLRRRFNKEEKPSKTVKSDVVGKRTPAATSVRPMTEEDRAEVGQMIIEMITSGGYTIEQAETQFGAGLRPEDWTAIRARVKEQGIKP